jgi:hypothetical protein
MPQVGFELTIPAFELAKPVHDLDCTATVIGYVNSMQSIKGTSRHSASLLSIQDCSHPVGWCKNRLIIAPGLMLFLFKQAPRHDACGGTAPRILTPN